MPKLDGYQTIETISDGIAGERYKNICIIALTANTMKEQQEQCYSSGMNDVLAKSLNPNELEEKLEQCSVQ